MSEAIIRVENLSKRYVLGRKRSQEDGLRHIIEDTLRAPIRWIKSRGTQVNVTPEEFWALKDVCFEINRGDVVGILGRNGAGKSTLLKILSRITEPSQGRVSLRGRVASLLEVGTGFHPELTGRENIFLNGAILGMSRIEIRRKFVEIVAFSEVERFLDTPVKRYSSGMYVRLAFAVAAHLDPEILIIDEVLAVGDVEFQKKCLGKMQSVAASGRTVLFVSHNLNAMLRLCTKGILLNSGQVQFSGTIAEACQQYGATTAACGKVSFENIGFIRQIEIVADGKASNGVVRPLSSIKLIFHIHCNIPLRNPRVSVAFNNTKGDRIFAVGSWLGPDHLPPLLANATVFIDFQMPPVIPGRYSVDIGLYNPDTSLKEEHYSAISLEVAETNFLGMTDQAIPEIGCLQVRSSCSILNA